MSDFIPKYDPLIVMVKTVRMGRIQNKNMVLAKQPLQNLALPIFNTWNL